VIQALIFNGTQEAAGQRQQHQPIAPQAALGQQQWADQRAALAQQQQLADQLALLKQLQKGQRRAPQKRQMVPGFIR
jgi:hypothetical protein